MASGRRSSARRRRCPGTRCATVRRRRAARQPPGPRAARRRGLSAGRRRAGWCGRGWRRGRGQRARRVCGGAGVCGGAAGAARQGGLRASWARSRPCRRMQRWLKQSCGERAREDRTSLRKPELPADSDDERGDGDGDGVGTVHHQYRPVRAADVANGGSSGSDTDSDNGGEQVWLRQEVHSRGRRDPAPQCARTVRKSLTAAAPGGGVQQAQARAVNVPMGRHNVRAKLQGVMCGA